MENKIIKQFGKLKNDRGSLLIVAYFVIIVFLGIGSAFMVLITNEAKTAERDKLATIAFHIAEAGIERGLYNLRQDFINDSTPSWADGAIYKDDSNDFAIGPNENDFYEIPYTDTTINGGSYLVEIKNVSGGKDVWLQSTGTINDVSHTLLVYTKIVDISPWGTAIFAGAGASGNMINGVVDIRGSVIILGTGLSDGDYAIDMGGTAEFVGNNYASMPADMRAKVPVLATAVVNGETVETLNAELRVKKGIVGLSGDSKVGQADNSGDAYKETVDAVFVEDGYGGNSGAASVYSDNGTANGWDLGDSISFPSLSDPSPDNPAQTVQEYFEANALILTNELSNITLGADTFNYSDANGSISLDASGNLVISGRVYIDGDNNLDFDSHGGDDTITYTGTGSILVTGDVTLDTNLITPTGVNTFPTNIIGIMTPGDMTLAPGAQRDLMGLFYAEGNVIVAKQTDLAGTVVSNGFNMGTNCPAIFQIPETANNMPAGMIGSNATWYMVVSWQKI